MAVSSSWTPDTPLNTDPLGSSDDEVRALKVALQERLRQGGHSIENSAVLGTLPDGVTARTLSNVGVHMCGMAKDSGQPGQQLGSFRIYASDGTSLVDFCDATHPVTPSFLNAANVGMSVGPLAPTSISCAGAVAALGLISGSAGLTISGGVVSLPADSIQTAEIQDAQITTPKLAASAVTNSTTQYTAGNLALSSSFQTLATATITTTPTVAGPVLLCANFIVVAMPATLLTYRIQRAGFTLNAEMAVTPLNAAAASGGVDYAVSFTWLDSGATANTSTAYTLQAKIATGTPNATNRSLTAIELRR